MYRDAPSHAFSASRISKHSRLACFFDCEKKWSVRRPHLRDACRPSTLLRRAEPFFRRNEIEALRTAVLRLLVVLHLVHFCPGHGLLVSPMSPSSMRHSVGGHLVLAHLVLAHLVILHFILLHLSAGRRRTAGKGRYNARTSQQDGANDGRT